MGLLIINGGLLVLAVALYRYGQHRVHEPDHLPLHAVAMPDLSAVASAPTPGVDVTAIREEALFYSRRTFYHPPAPSQVVPALEYELAGTMTLPKGMRVAFVKKKSDQTNRTLHEGNDFEGWRVESIDSGHLVLARGDQRSELKSVSPQATPGLLRGTVRPQVVQTGLRTLGSSSAFTVPLPQTSTTARTYRPPPP
jgi:hypothetical protein